jgi:hypothetical protein
VLKVDYITLTYMAFDGQLQMDATSANIAECYNTHTSVGWVEIVNSDLNKIYNYEISILLQPLPADSTAARTNFRQLIPLFQLQISLSDFLMYRNKIDKR